MSPAVARTGKIKLNHDAVVPRSRIPAMLDFIEELGRDTGFLIPRSDMRATAIFTST